MKVVTDDDVRKVPATVMVGGAREALLQFGRAEMLAPPRARTELGSIDYVYTAGALADGTSGFRAYRAGQPAGDQIVAVWEPSGRLSGLVVGDELGARRTGAIGAVATDVLARPDADHVAVIGAGAQAWTQIWALASIRSLDKVSVHSRSRQHREDFAARVSAELGLNAEAVADPGAALRVADIIVLATRSTTPVIDMADVAPGTHVTTVGPKSQFGHEAPLGLVEASALITCDAPAQAAAYPEPFFTGSTPLVSLAEVLLGTAPGRQNTEDITLHCSVGLAGSEVLIARKILDSSS